MTALRVYTTTEAATVTRYKRTTLYRELCVRGSFKGIKPIRLEGGRLLWPADQIDALLTGSGANSEAVTASTCHSTETAR